MHQIAGRKIDLLLRLSSQLSTTSHAEVREGENHYECIMSVYTPMMHCCLAFVLKRVQILFATPKSNEETINDQALRRIQRDIDLGEARLERPARKSR